MAFGNGPRIVNNGLVLCLDASDRNSYPGSGTTWFDVSGKNNNSSLNNGPTYSSDNNGTIVLDGTNDIIYAPSCNDLGGLQNQTFEIWVKSPGLGPGKYVGGLICPDYGQISYIGADGNITYYIYNTDAGYPGTYTLSIGTSGVNKDGVDGKWGDLSQTAFNQAKAIKAKSTPAVAPAADSVVTSSAANKPLPPIDYKSNITPDQQANIDRIGQKYQTPTVSKTEVAPVQKTPEQIRQQSRYDQGIARQSRRNERRKGNMLQT